MTLFEKRRNPQVRARGTTGLSPLWPLSTLGFRLLS
jgi:hypothetical protein